VNVWVDCGDCYEGGLPVPIRVVRTEIHAVASDAFPHLGLTLLRGRDFDESVDVGRLRVAIVSRALAARHFEDGEALGRAIRVGDSPWLTVVGVVDDPPDARDHREYSVYLPLAQAAPSEIEIIAGPSPESMASALRSAPEAAEIAPARGAAVVFAAHGWFRMVLGLLGGAAYALVFLGVWLGARNEARATTFELSLRKAVGARRRDLHARFVTATGKRLTVAFGLGVWLSLFLGAGLSDAYGAMPHLDGQVWLRVALLVAVAYLVGAWPAWLRASRTPPAVGLVVEG